MNSITASTSKCGSSTEPPYCFKSVDELRKNQTRYNQYNIFHMVERLRLLEAQGTVESIDSVDESSNAYKMYKDFVVPPLPPAYEHLNLPPHWLIHMFSKKEKKRSHKKNVDGLMPFQQLAQAIADAYKKVDKTTKAWLDEAATKLLAYNQTMRNNLAKHLTEGGKPAAASTGDSLVAVAPKQGTQEDVPSVGQNESLRYTIPSEVTRAAIDERIRYLQNEVQALQSSRFSATLQHGDRYPGTGRGRVLNERNVLGQCLYEANSPHETSSLFPRTGVVGSWLPLPLAQSESLLRRESYSKRKMSPGSRSRSLLNYIEVSHKRKQSEKEDPPQSMSNRDAKRVKSETLETALDELRARVASEEAFNLSDIGGAGLASLGGVGSCLPRPFESGESSRFLDARNDQIMLGYRLGLEAAARARASSGLPRGFPDFDVSSGLQALRHRVSTVDSLDRADAYTRSEFGLTYSDVLGALNKMKKND